MLYQDPYRESDLSSTTPVAIAPMQPSNGPAPQSLSRYRSVRQAAASKTQDPNVSTAPGQHASSATIARSMSRYRRHRDPALKTPNLLASHPPMPVLADRDLQERMRQSALDATARQGLPPQSVKAEDRFLNGNSKCPTYARNKTQMGQDDHQARHRQESMDRLTGCVEHPPPSENPFLDRNAIKDKGQSNSHEHEARRNRDSSNRSPANSDTRISWMDKMKNSLSRDPKPAVPVAAVPGIDAPNSGERKVRIQYKQSSLVLSVTATTHAEDLLFAASNHWTDIDASTFILMESFAASQISLERPVRRYEYVREILNSWAYDNENFLFIIPPASAEALHRLELHAVAAEKKPSESIVHVYHSQKPRKWDKRHVTLRTDGQVTVSKKALGKSESNICHISDFDIYSPTTQTVAEAKAPKRFCYVIKSQQKSSLFVSTEKFVHFFATDDRRVADSWYQAVQYWRSWYMVNMLGAGDPQVDARRRNEALGKSHHSNRNSADQWSSDPESQPLPLIEQVTSSKELFARRRGAREHGPPPPAFPRNLTIDTGSESVPGPLLQKDESPFSPAGLLGETYTMRQRDMREREEREKHEIFSPQGLVHRQASAPVAQGSQQNSRSNTMKTTQAPDMTGFSKRCHSGRQPPKPLVDLTPVFQEQPQHRNKGRGVTVTPGVPLVEAATGPDLAPGGIVIPPATTWRRPQHRDDPPISHSRSRYRSNTARSTSQHHRMPPSTYRTAPSSPTEYTSPENPFAPNSLLARAPNTTANGTRPFGHGVATGDRNATKPMLDLTDDNPFAQGSLLRGL